MSFGRLALLSPVVNLVVVPLVAPAMAAGLAALAGGALVVAGAPAVVGAVAAAPGWVLLRILVAVVETAAGLPFASVTLGPPFDLGAAAIASSALVGVSWWRRRASVESALGRPRSGTSPRPPKPRTDTRGDRPGRGRPSATRRHRGLGHRRGGGRGSLRDSAGRESARVSVLDVGQGDAILVEGSRGGRLLIDGGPDPDRLLVRLDERIPPWDRRIDAVILTHPHEDHVAGLALLLERYHVGRVFEPGMRGPGPGYAAWLRELVGPGRPIRLGLAAGDRLAVDEIALRVLWPIRGQVPGRRRRTAGPGSTTSRSSCLAPSASTGSCWWAMSSRPSTRRCWPTICRVSTSSRSRTTAARPRRRRRSSMPSGRRIAVASAGTGNPYGHPAQATLDRLAASGARVFRTDRDGTVVVTFEPDGLTVRAEGWSGGRTASGPAATACGRRGVPLCASRSPALPEAEAGAPTEPAVARIRPGWRRASATILPMTIPGRVDAASLLLSLDPPTWFVRHARAVAEVAGFLAARIDGRGIAVDRRLVEAAALLHDVDKILPADDPARALPHGDGSADWLTRHGHPELARSGGGASGDPAARRRALPPLVGLRQSRGADRGLRRQAGGSTPELDGRPVRLMAASVRRWDAVWARTARAVRPARGRLEADVCRAAGIAPSEVRRLRWTGSALRAARATMAS